MKFTPTKIEGVWIIEMERHQDERGWFARTWCAEEFRAHGLESGLSQCSSSFNLRRGTLRGMHYQAAPYEEAKMVRCVRGAMQDVALDLRPTSPTYREWVAVELTPENGVGLYIPKGCAHGFQTWPMTRKYNTISLSPIIPMLAAVCDGMILPLASNGRCQRLPSSPPAMLPIPILPHEHRNTHFPSRQCLLSQATSAGGRCWRSLPGHGNAQGPGVDREI